MGHLPFDEVFLFRKCKTYTDVFWRDAQNPSLEVEENEPEDETLHTQK